MTLGAATTARIAALLGSEPAGFEPRAGGYTRAITGLTHLADGRSAFVKTADPTCPPDDPLLSDLRDEIAALSAIAATRAAPFAPHILAVADDPLPLLLLEDLSDAAWPHPYPGDLRPLARALDALAAVTPPAVLGSVTDEPGAAGPWSAIAADPAPVVALGIAPADWLEAALPALIEAEARVRFEGGSLVHGDLWYANLCFARRGPVIVDWASAMRGNATLDRATVALDLLESGWPTADLSPLEVPDLVSWIAWLAGHQARAATLPPDPIVAPGSALRDEQAATARTILPHVAAMLGLAPVVHTRRG